MKKGVAFEPPLFCSALPECPDQGWRSFLLVHHARIVVLHVEVLRQALGCLRAADEKIPPRLEHRVDLAQDFGLQVSGEIDEDVSTKHHIEATQCDKRILEVELTEIRD